jgi:hypothetical protein
MMSWQNKQKGEVLILPVACIVLGAYLLASYVVMPAVKKPHHKIAVSQDFPKTAFKKNGIPGDPLNIGFVGSDKDIVVCMEKAGWHQAAKLTLFHFAREVGAIVVDCCYNHAPVSGLYLFGRRQDIAFEKFAARSPKERHHVRFWKTDIVLEDGSFFWAGAATFDRKIGFSHLTGEITHHIAPDIDSEREQIISNLKLANVLEDLYYIQGIGLTLSGINAEGDKYYTDGKLAICILNKS